MILPECPSRNNTHRIMIKMHISTAINAITMALFVIMRHASLPPEREIRHSTRLGIEQ